MAPSSRPEGEGAPKTKPRSVIGTSFYAPGILLGGFCVPTLSSAFLVPAEGANAFTKPFIREPFVSRLFVVLLSLLFLPEQLVDLPAVSQQQRIGCGAAEARIQLIQS